MATNVSAEAGRGKSERRKGAGNTIGKQTVSSNFMSGKKLVRCERRLAPLEGVSDSGSAGIGNVLSACGRLPSVRVVIGATGAGTFQ